MERERFSKHEAEAKIGRRVRSLVEFSGVPKGTAGTVIRADSAGLEKAPGREAVETFDVAIQWNLPSGEPALACGESVGERFIAVRSGKPLVDWFTKSEYERFLAEEP